MGGSSSSHSEQYRKRDPDSQQITDLQNNLYSQNTPMVNQIGSDTATGNANYSKYGTYMDNAYNGLNNLTTTGELPSAMTSAINQYITRNMDKSLGTAMSKAAGTGRLNSSVTGKAINEIATNTADAYAQNYLNAYNAASSNYNNLINDASNAQSKVWSDFNDKYAEPLDFYKIARNSEDQEDYDTVVYQDSGK